jgi:hypothetical protein
VTMQITRASHFMGGGYPTIVPDLRRAIPSR